MRHGNDLLAMVDDERKRRMEEPAMKLTHITLTDAEAGLVLCGASKDLTAANFAHVPYTRYREWLARPEICPLCVHMYDCEDAACSTCPPSFHAEAE